MIEQPVMQVTLANVTLRDFLAAQALNGYSANNTLDNFTFEQVAYMSYRMADAMLSERDKR